MNRLRVRHAFVSTQEAIWFGFAAGLIAGVLLLTVAGLVI